MQKDFDKWNEKKKQIENNIRNLLFKEWDIWRCSLWLNIKTESCWKWDDFRRPILVLKKLSSDSCIAIPLSTQMKEWTWFVSYTLHDVNYTALLHQIKMINKNRFQRKLWELDEKDFSEIKKRLKILLNL